MLLCTHACKLQGSGRRLRPVSWFFLHLQHTYMHIDMRVYTCTYNWHIHSALTLVGILGGPAKAPRQGYVRNTVH